MFLIWTLILTADFSVNLTRHIDFEVRFAPFGYAGHTDFEYYGAYSGCERSAEDAYSS
jgi:hypothetical protein